jgi:hypothetical protein
MLHLLSPIVDRATLDAWLVIYYINNSGRGPKREMGVSLHHGAADKEENKRDARHFASASVFDSGSGLAYVISYARALNSLPRRVRIGVLLHEIAHLLTWKSRRDASEVAADVWISRHVPEAEFNYAGASYTHKGRHRSAKNVETVCSEFLRLIDPNTSEEVHRALERI